VVVVEREDDAPRLCGRRPGKGLGCLAGQRFIRRAHGAVAIQAVDRDLAVADEQHEVFDGQVGDGALVPVDDEEVDEDELDLDLFLETDVERFGFPAVLLGEPARRRADCQDDDHDEKVTEQNGDHRGPPEPRG
jgi:hypothetical protein